MTALVGLMLLAVPGPAGSKVFFAQDEALALAFPDSDRVDRQTFVLTDDQAARIEKLSRSPLDSRLVTVHTGWQGEHLQGYAVIDIHTVRTLPEAFMVVLRPDGVIQSLRVLAFYEPLEYLPTKRWYEQFFDKSAEEPLRVGRDIHGVVGATLSTRAASTGVRRALAYYEVLLNGEL